MLTNKTDVNFQAVALGDTTQNWEPPACQIGPPARSGMAGVLLWPMVALVVMARRGRRRPRVH
jgi:hypothetical protein